MRRLRYQVAMSLDGFIAGPKGEYDWIPMDPEIDFQALFAQFDALVMGRNTFLPMAESATDQPFNDKQIYVVSKTLDQANYPNVVVLPEEWQDEIRVLKQREGKDIWLFGGGQLFRSCLSAGLVDTVEIALIPVLLGEGIPMLPSPCKMQALRLTRHQVYQQTGIILLEYDCQPNAT